MTHKVKRINWVTIDLAKLILCFTKQSDIISILFSFLFFFGCKERGMQSIDCYNLFLLLYYAPNICIRYI